MREQVTGIGGQHIHHGEALCHHGAIEGALAHGDIALAAEPEAIGGSGLDARHLRVLLLEAAGGDGRNGPPGIRGDRSGGILEIVLAITLRQRRKPR